VKEHLVLSMQDRSLSYWEYREWSDFFDCES